MALSEKQQGVLRGMVIGAITACLIVAFGIALNPFAFPPNLPLADRLSVALTASLLPALFLAVSIGSLAKHRFFTPEDIDGGGLSAGTERAKILQSLLQNTLEQTVLAVLVYFAWANVMPSTWLSVVPLAASAFALGRILFFVGYQQGAPSRAVGFTLAFYPSLIMLVCLIGAIVWRQFS